MMAPRRPERPSPPRLQAEFLRSVFEQFGNVQFVKYLREK